MHRFDRVRASLCFCCSCRRMHARPTRICACCSRLSYRLLLPAFFRGPWATSTPHPLCLLLPTLASSSTRTDGVIRIDLAGSRPAPHPHIYISMGCPNQIPKYFIQMPPGAATTVGGRPPRSGCAATSWPLRPSQPNEKVRPKISEGLALRRARKGPPWPPFSMGNRGPQLPSQKKTIPAGRRRLKVLASAQVHMSAQVADTASGTKCPPRSPPQLSSFKRRHLQPRSASA